MQENVGEKNDESEWSKRKKKKIINSSVGQVEGWFQLRKNKPQFRQGWMQFVADGQQKVIKRKIDKRKSIK